MKSVIKISSILLLGTLTLVWMNNEGPDNEIRVINNIFLSTVAFSLSAVLFGAIFSLKKSRS